MKDFSGAGILIIEKYKNQPVITLFGSNKLGFGDAGGKKDHNENPEETASRECREETENLIHLKSHELSQHGHPIQINRYIGYVMYVKNLSENDYNHNVHKIHNKCKQKHWKETNKMIRIPFNNINYKSNVMLDIHNKPRQIQSRAMAILKIGSRAIKQIISDNNPVDLYKHNVTNSRMSCLIGTYTYTLNNKSQYTQQHMLNPQLNLQTSPQLNPQMSPLYTSPYSPQFDPQNLPMYDPQSLAYAGEYAIYIAPRLSMYSDPFLLNCNKTWGGLHVTLTGFHFQNQPPIAKKFMEYISSLSMQPWSINVSKISVYDRMIYFDSSTLNQIADFLYTNGFQNVKGQKYANTMWHILCECPIPQNIVSLLAPLQWDLVLIQNTNGYIQWLDRYPLHTL